MYTPESFVVNDLARLHDFVEQNSFAIIFHGATSSVTHMPLLLERGRGPKGALVGHMAKANPHWRVADGQEVLTVFSGPHAYISPRWLQAKNVVPTWNYVAVHAHGVLRIEHDREALRETIDRYVTTYEASEPEPWAASEADASFVDQLLDAIVGFSIEIHELEGKWKLNQNHDELRRRRVIEGLLGRSDASSREIARLIQETL